MVQPVRRTADMVKNEHSFLSCYCPSGGLNGVRAGLCRWGAFFFREQLHHPHKKERDKKDRQEGSGNHPAQDTGAHGHLCAGAGPGGHRQGQ